MLKFINCTPHPITLVRPGRPAIEVPPSGHVARVSMRETVRAPIEGIPTLVRVPGAVEGIPEPTPGDIFIVSSMVLAHTDRPGVVAPDTGDTAIRNKTGHIVGVTRLVRAG